MYGASGARSLGDAMSVNSVVTNASATILLEAATVG